ncbi:MAG: chromosome segregation SMC family protein [Brevinematia bacterium]
MARYLKSIILQGFKSFPLKTEIEFIDGITGIVGANGSGKSNIIESIRWVLGEQSARSLRGEKMEDIIFNGTKNRLPSSMAEVTLVFDNEKKWLPIEYSEVEITRRMFRSGEGQYFINKSRVRLKDIVELFLDTGIGRDSYAIFEQGKIDRLLSESPEERRFLFEEFAGISKFKFRKEEAEKKLENSKLNLERVNDLILTLEKEVESLKSQAETAERYNELKSRLRDFELRFEALRAKNFKREIETKNKQRDDIERKLNLLLKDIEKRESNLIEIESNIIELETKYTNLKEDYSRLEKDSVEREARISGYLDKKMMLEKQLLNMEKKLEEGILKESSLREEEKRINAEFENVGNEKDEIEEKLTSLQMKIDNFQGGIKKLDEMLIYESKSLGFDRIVSKDDVERLKSELVSIQMRGENLRSKMEEKWNVIRAMESKYQEVLEQLENKKKSMERQKSELEGILKEIDERKSKEVELKKEIKELEERISKFQEEQRGMDRVILEALEKQAVRLKSFHQEKEKFDKSIESILKDLKEKILAKDFNINLVDMIDELDRILKDYRFHYESILSIIYNDEEGYLKKEALQKNIDECRKQISEIISLNEGIELKLKELAGVKEELQKNFNRTEFEYGKLLEEEMRYKKSISDGLEDIKGLENQISISVNSMKSKQNLLESIMKLIDKYESEIRGMREEKSKFFEELNRVKIDWTRLDEKRKALGNELKRVRSQISEIEAMKNGFETEKNSITEAIKEIERKMEIERRESSELKEKLTSLGKEIESLKSNLDGFQKERKFLENERKELENNYQKLERQLMNIENGISERKVLLENLRENVMKSFGVEVDAIELKDGDNFDDLSKEINLCREAMRGFGEINFLAIEQYQNAKERMAFLVSQREDIEKAINDIEGLIKETNAKSEEKFLNSFEDIRKAFKKIFARLFDGGRADLILENKEDVMSSGINIMAEPPGKKFQSISLLSGGERALVAIAVIFSILYLKPTPFVVLDEMDAPLDDDNIERFKCLLKDFRETSQFIIVSHSKSTLEICDALYGVTMEEQGVSKVVSVAFDEAEKIVESLEVTS